MIRQKLILFKLELKLLARDRQALGLLFLMPLALIIFLTLALQDVYLAKVGQDEMLTVVTTPDGCYKPDDLCADLLKDLVKNHYRILVTTKLPPERKIHIALVMPKDLSASLSAITTDQPLADKDRVQIIFDPLLDNSVRSAIEARLGLSLVTVLLKQMPADSPHLDPQKLAGLLEKKTAGGFVLPNPLQQTVPAWALFGMFFIGVPLASSMIRDRRMGIYKRLLSFPISATDLIVGKILPFWFINILQFALMFIAGFCILPHFMHLELNLDLNWLQLVVITAAAACAATSYGAMIASVSRTPEQASSYGSLSVVILAVLGGVMIPRFVMPEFMQKASLVSPLFWALDGYHDIMLRHEMWPMIFAKAGILMLYSLAFVLISLWRFRWHEVH